MPWPGAKLRARKLKSYAACWTNKKWTNTKGSGDDHAYELAFSEHNAFPGLDATALSVARHGRSGVGRGSDDAVPALVGALRAGCGGAHVDAGCAHRHILLSL